MTDHELRLFKLGSAVGEYYRKPSAVRAGMITSKMESLKGKILTANSTELRDLAIMRVLMGLVDNVHKEK